MADARRWLTISLGTGFVLGVAQACLINDPNHCRFSTEADPCPGAEVCDPCTSSEMNNGCVPAVLARCAEPDGPTTTNDPTENGPDTVTTIEDTVTTTADSETESTTVTPGDTETSTSTGMPPACTADSGTYDPTCPENEPFCVSGTCTRCDDGSADTSCATAVGAPGRVCSDEGACVECTEANATDCTMEEPVCDPMTNQCRQCVAHDECPDAAGCHLFEGTCLPGNAVIYASDEGANCDDSMGLSPEMPTCSLGAAVDQVTVGGQATIRLAAGTYVEDISIPANSVVAILANNDATITADNGNPSVRVLAGTTAYLSRLAVQNILNFDGIESQGNVWLERVRIEGAARGLYSTAGRVRVENSRILNNDGAGVSVGGTDPVLLRNVIIAGNGTGTAPQGFITTGNTPYTLVYVTIADNSGTNAGAINSPSGMGVVRNSILVSGSLANSVVTAGTLDISNSIVADDDYSGMNGNMPIGAIEELMFDTNYEISADSIAQGVAIWEDGDPPTDINGVPRPSDAGSSDYAGADLPN